MSKQKYFSKGDPKPIYGNIADYVKMEKAEKGSRFFIICPDCGMIRNNKRWFWDPKVKESDRKEASFKKCPGCEAIENGWAEGELTLKNKILKLVPYQIEELIKNLEEEYRHDDPKNRIVKINKAKNIWKVYTASVFLARRIGEELEKTYASKVSFKFLKGDQFVRVVWEDKA